MSPKEYVVVGTVVLALGGVLWCGIGLICLAVARTRARQSARMVAVPGRLLSIRPAFVRLKGRAGIASYWTVEADYVYEVAGVPHRGHRFALEFHSWFPDEASAATAAAALRPGTPVTVWYDPGQPSRAVLDRTPPETAAYRRFALWSAVGAIALVLLAWTFAATL